MLERLHARLHRSTGGQGAGALFGLLALVAAAFAAAPAMAQGGPNPPPRQDTQSPAGVSLQSGAYSHDSRDLAIGGADLPVGLSLNRSYLSSLASERSAYSGFTTQGWNTSLNVRVGNSVVAAPWQQPPPGQENYLYSVAIGNRSVGFTGGTTHPNPTGGFVGTYAAVNTGGEQLVYIGTEATGHFEFTDSDGTVLVLNGRGSGREALAISSLTAPDGTRLVYSYGSYGLTSVFSNRGYALLFEYESGNISRACAVNLATTYVTPTSPCPAGAQTVTYQYTAGAVMPMLTGFTNAAGQTTTYAYATRDHLTCITLPGQTACQISNVYGLCVPPVDPDGPPSIPPDMRVHEQVRSQTLATGETYVYSFPAARECPPTPFEPRTTTMTVSDTATTTVEMNGDGMPTSITDPIGRETEMSYTGQGAWSFMGGPPSTPETITRPEENSVHYSYDGRGNILEERVHPKPSAGGEPGNHGGDIVRTAFYPASCNPRTCSRPEYVIDARGQRTDFTYDPTHGGVLTETGPADAALIRPQARYTYQQRYAWVRTASGGYSQAATPVWLRASESRCRTSAATGNPAAPCTAANDEVVTSYDYGADGVPNNLLLRGTLVSGAGASARTCYTYDANGNRLSETGPGAALASCP
jgi:YD repeat-containing protein